MSSKASTASRASGHAAMTSEARSRLLRVWVLPLAVSAVAMVVSASFGHVMIGVFVGIGVALGAANGLLMERATAKITPDSAHERQDIVKSSLGRLALVSLVAMVVAVVARPDGWVLLPALACYQILMLLSLLGAAKREARLG